MNINKGIPGRFFFFNKKLSAAKMITAAVTQIGPINKVPIKIRTPVKASTR